MSEPNEDFIYCEPCPYTSGGAIGTPHEEPGLCKDCLMERVIKQKKIIVEQGYRIQDLEGE